MTEPIFSQIYQTPIEKKMLDGLHHKLRAAGMKTMWTTFAHMPFGNIISNRNKIIEKISATKPRISDGWKTLHEEKIIKRNSRVIRVTKRYCSRDAHKNKKLNWFRLLPDGSGFINHPSLGFYEQSVVLAIFSSVKYGNIVPIKSISATAKMLGIPRDKCSKAFKKLLDLGFILQFPGDKLIYLNPKIGEKGGE